MPNRIEPLRRLARLDHLLAIPGILDIDVLWEIVALGLDRAGHTDVRPLVAIVIELFESRHGFSRAVSIGKFPQAIEGMAERIFTGQGGLARWISMVVGMGRQSIVGKKTQVIDFLDVECCHGSLRAGCI